MSEENASSSVPTISTMTSTNNGENNNNNNVTDSPLRRTFQRHFSFSPSDSLTAPLIRRQRSNSISSVATSNSMAMMATAPLQLARYFSRREHFAKSSSNDLLINPRDDEKFVGIYSPVAVFWGIVFLIIPAAYLYIALVLLRELCRIFPDTVYVPIQYYIPWLGNFIQTLNNVSRWVEIWCCLEAIFYIGLKLHIKWLQTRDPLEASLSAAPMMNLSDRLILFQRMMKCEYKDPVSFLRGWFFDQPLDNISKYDVRDFLAWCMYEGRHQEHLTEAELHQLESFVEVLEQKISLHLYGEKETSNNEEDDDDGNNILDDNNTTNNLLIENFDGIWDKTPKKKFTFSEETNVDEPNYFSELYESYRKAYEESMKAMRDATADFHPVQGLRSMMNDAITADLDNFNPVKDLKNLMAETGKTIGKAEERAKATATQMYETLVPAGSQMDKRINEMSVQMDKRISQMSAMSNATYNQMTDAWNSVKQMKEKLETARLLRKQRQRVKQQLKGYRELLNQMRGMSSEVPSHQMANMMRRITECNEKLHKLENIAKQTAFAQRATGYAMNNIPSFFHQKEVTKPQRFAKYSSDPLLGIAVYPLFFSILVLGLTEIPLRILMQARGFDRRVMGRVAYYFHPGTDNEDDLNYDTDSEDDDECCIRKTPIVFVHGIGLGLLPYLPLIDALLKTGRPILLPEIPYVSGFRPFQSPKCVLPPAVVCSTMTAMLASHGYLKATWMGHSYGTSWLSYMCKYASNSVAAVLFLDPICFCLQQPYLTKQFVYLKPDVGTVSYMVRTDVIVNWTIQRSFPWAWVILFTEQINAPCTVFLSESDALVPATKVEEYLKTKNVPIQDFDSCTEEFFYSGKIDTNNKQSSTENDNNELKLDDLAATQFANNDDQQPDLPQITCSVFRGHGHGDWTEQVTTIPKIVSAAQALCRRVEETC